MRRWHNEVALMQRRHRVELSKHQDRTTGELNDCHCLAGIGTMRKHRPNEKCGNRCKFCAWERDQKRRARKKARQVLKRVADPIEFVRGERWW